MNRSTLVVVAVLSLFSGGCGAAETVDDAETQAREGPSGLYEANATVLDNGYDGPMLCLGTILTSLPPQCGDVPIANWDWNAVKTEQTRAGTSWGDYHVVGTYDGERFAVTEVGPYEESEPEPGGDPFASPCPEPEGGWVASDPGRTSQEDFDAAARFAESQPDAVAVWVSVVGNPDPEELDRMSLAGRPIPRILNAVFTGDAERHEDELRDLWGGPLCVTERETYTATELDEIRAEVEGEVLDELGLQMLWSQGGGVEGLVEIGVVAAGEEAQRALDERYGAGAVRLYPALLPLR
jgi:hypothetical protein